MGRPHDLIAFDEAGHFNEEQYRFLTGWLRTADPNQRTRIVCASNPPTNSEGEWLIRRWAAWLDSKHPNPAKPGELRWYAIIDGKDTEVESGEPFEYKSETITPRSRSFLPAKLSDNPYLEATGYRSVLQGMPEPLRSQMLYGDFSVGVNDDHAYTVIPTAWVRHAMSIWREDGRIRSLQTDLGVDVSRGGKDKTVIASRHGLWVAPLLKYPGSSTPDGNTVAGYVLEALESPMVNPAAIKIDVIGVGASPYDILTRHPRLDRVYPLNSSEKSEATDKSGYLSFANKRAEWWWNLRELLDPASGYGIQLPDDPELLADLTAPRWQKTPRGEIKVESKEEIIKRLGRSPDAGDAVVYAFAKMSDAYDFEWLKNL